MYKMLYLYLYETFEWHNHHCRREFSTQASCHNDHVPSSQEKSVVSQSQGGEGHLAREHPSYRLIYCRVPFVDPNDCINNFRSFSSLERDNSGTSNQFSTFVTSVTFMVIEVTFSGFGKIYPSS